MAPLFGQRRGHFREHQTATNDDQMDNHKYPLGQINVQGMHDFFDVIRLRLSRALKRTELQFLCQNTEGARLHRGHYVRGFISDVLTIARPEQNALVFLTELPGAMVNYLEIARDLILPEGEAGRVHDSFDVHFVQSWHRKHETIIRLNGTTSYSGQRRRGHWFAWYSDRPCKVTGEVECFHIEGRHQGITSLRKIGVQHPRDLLTFDHEAYWSKHMRLYFVDFERLGRLFSNMRSGERRRRPRVQQCGPIFYNFDRAAGSLLFRKLSTHRNQLQRSVQRFVDVFGRGPFLMPLALFNDYVSERKLSAKPIS
jgi:hypothetical protein